MNSENTCALVDSERDSRIHNDGSRDGRCESMIGWSSLVRESRAAGPGGGGENYGNGERMKLFELLVANEVLAG